MSDRQVTLCECSCMESGRIQERERILTLLPPVLNDALIRPLTLSDEIRLIFIIKGEQK